MDPLIATDYGYLKLDGTEDDDGDDYDEVVLNKLVILLVKDVAALCFQERGVGHGLCPCCVDTANRRAKLQK